MPLSDDVGFACFGFEEKWVWLALIQFGEELNLNEILVEFWPMLLPGGCPALKGRAGFGVGACVVRAWCRLVRRMLPCPPRGQGRKFWCASLVPVRAAGAAELFLGAPE